MHRDILAGSLSLRLRDGVCVYDPEGSDDSRAFILIMTRACRRHDKRVGQPEKQCGKKVPKMWMGQMHLKEGKSNSPGEVKTRSPSQREVRCSCSIDYSLIPM